MSALSALVPAAERSLVHRKAAQARAEAVAGGPGSLLPGEVVRRVSYVVTAIAPRLPRRRLSLLVGYALWTVLLDDRLDVRDAEPAALRRVRDLVVDATAPAGVPAGEFARGMDPDRPAPDPLAAMLAGILAGLAECGEDAGAALARLGTALRDAVGSGLAHALLARRVAGGAAPPPTAECYLARAARSVNYRSFGYALLAADGAALDADALDRLDPALWQAAYAVRLSNDLASLARDRAEGTLNVLDLCTRCGAAVTRARVRDQIDRHVRRHRELLAQVAGDPRLAGPARALTRSLRLSIDLYRHSDLR